MIFSFDECIFITEHALRCNYDQVEDLNLTLDDLFASRVTTALLDEIVTTSGPLLTFFLKNLLQLCTILLIVLINYYNLLGHLELSIFDKKDTVSPITLFIEHFISLESSLLQAFPKVLLCISGELTE